MPESSQEPVRVVAGAESVELGSLLFTIVEPHKGFEVEYNRWYERDHLYSGCMIGPYNFAARRFVATSDLKKLRDPDPSEITGNPERGSYLAMYWILKGYGHIWGKWAGQQVMALHKAGRMFEERDHVHTVLYDYKWSLGRDPNGVPVELALDHPYNGLVAEFIDRSEGIDQSDFDRYLANDHLPNILAGSSAGLVAACSPQPMKSGAPGVESKQANTDRTLLLWFLDLNPSSMTDALASHRTRLEADGMGTVKAILPFMPTIPGTDTYTDQLWG